MALPFSILAFMGQWNTLHLFDEKRFYEQVVPAVKTNKELMSNYYDKFPLVFYTYEDDDEPVVSKAVRIESAMWVANRMSEDFRSYPYDKRHPTERYEYCIDDLQDFLFVAAFSECALFFPYVKLGYRLLYSALDLDDPNPVVQLINRIYHPQYEQGIFPGESMIRNWVSHAEVAAVMNTLESLEPRLRTDEPIKNEWAKGFVNTLKAFFQVANDHGLGMICCLDPDEYQFKGVQPVGGNIEWKQYGLNKSLIFS